MDREQVKEFISEHGPDILSGVATAGVLLTAGLSIRAGIKIERKQSSTTYFTKGQKIKSVLKYYILPAVSSLGTIGAIWGSNRLSSARIVSLLGTVGYLAANRKELEKRLPVEDVSKSRLEASKSSPSIPSIESTGKGDQICLEGFSGRWFRSSKEEVEKQIRTFNERWREELKAYGFAYTCLNDLYSLLGIQTTHLGWHFGWSSEMSEEEDLLSYSMIDLENGLGEVIVIEPIDCPYECWMEY